jgi:hypothetical protein
VEVCSRRRRQADVSMDRRPMKIMAGRSVYVPAESHHRGPWCAQQGSAKTSIRYLPLACFSSGIACLFEEPIADSLIDAVRLRQPLVFTPRAQNRDVLVPKTLWDRPPRRTAEQLSHDGRIAAEECRGLVRFCSFNKRDNSVTAVSNASHSTKESGEYDPLRIQYSNANIPHRTQGRFRWVSVIPQPN